MEHATQKRERTINRTVGRPGLLTMPNESANGIGSDTNCAVAGEEIVEGRNITDIRLPVFTFSEPLPPVRLVIDNERVAQLS
jgi:hypothetical protein